MKRTLILLPVIIVTVIIFSVMTNESGAADKTCCQKFHVENTMGEPVAGCTITLSPCYSPCQCTTDSNGNCCIDITVDTPYTASVSCPGHLMGGTQFSPDCDAVINITVQ